jgi:hypothetical protein
MRRRETPSALAVGREMLASERAPLTAKQERAIAELLARPTMESAAEAVGVTALTLRRWRQNPAFSAAYRRARMEAQEEAAGRLRLLSGIAVQSLADVLADPETKDADRIRAAAVVLDLAFRDSWREPKPLESEPVRVFVSFTEVDE